MKDKLWQSVSFMALRVKNMWHVTITWILISKSHMKDVEKLNQLYVYCFPSFNPDEIWAPITWHFNKKLWQFNKSEICCSYSNEWSEIFKMMFVWLCVRVCVVRLVPIQDSSPCSGSGLVTGLQLQLGRQTVRCSAYVKGKTINHNSSVKKLKKKKHLEKLKDCTLAQ